MRKIYALLVLLLMIGGSANVWGQCNISVTMSSPSWGDGTTWQLRDASNNVVLNGGPYGNGYNQTLTLSNATNGPFTLQIISTLGDNFPNYSVSVNSVVQYSGTAPANQTTNVGPITCPPPAGGCDIAVTMSSPSWGDGTTWQLRDASNNVVLSGGPYGNGYNQTLTLSNATNGPFTLQIISTLGDNFPNYSVSVNSVVQYSGTAPANQTTNVGPITCPPPGGCSIDVTMSSPSWGDGTTWQLRDASNNVVLSGGPYGNGYNQTLTLSNATNGPFTLQIISTLGDNFPNYSVSVNSVVQYSGSAPANQTTNVGPITCGAPPPAFDPCSSIPNITTCGTATSTTWTAGQTGAWNPIANTCGFATPGQERLFTFTPTVSGIHQINVTAIAGGWVNFFWKAASGGCNNTGWTCILDVFGNGTFGSLNMTAGVQYYIMADPEHTNAGNLTFNIVCPPPPSPTSITASTSTLCDNALAPVTLTANGASGTVYWFTSGCNTSGWIATGNPTTVNPTTTTTYFARNFDGTQWSAACASTTVVVNQSPTAAAGPALAAICQGGTSAAMGGSVGGGATGGTWSGGAGSWTNANDPANATYTAGLAESGTITLTLTTSGGSCGTTSVSKTIVVNPNPTAAAGPALAAICQGGTSAAMGGSVGGGATGGTWSGGAGSWTNANDPANATYTADAAESGTITLTLTTSGGSCGTTSVSKTIVVDAASVAATSINNLNPVICHGASMQLDVVGGSLAAGAQWEWFESSCGSTVIGTGASINVTPTGATDYFVRATSANSCAPTACTSISVTMPTTSTNLAVDGDIATCVVNSGNWIHFYDVNGRLIASVNSNGQNLGNVTATSLVAGSPSTVTSCTQPWDPSWFNAVLARTFEISPTTQPTSPVSVRLYISQSEFDDYQNYAATVTTGNLNDEVATIDDMGLTKHSGTTVNGNPANICDAGVNIFVPQSGSGNTSTLFPGFANSYFIEYSITGFSSFFPMNSGNSPLPVTMTSFNANCDGDKVNIAWTTASEYNASHFSVQTSRDGQYWTEVAQIEAAGTTSQTTNYFYQDMRIGGVSYYRLVQVDFDGEYEVFGPISVDCEINESSMTVYPNPTDKDFTVLIQTTETFENATIELVDLSGRSVQVKEMNILPGSTQVRFETNGIMPGTYIVRIKGENDKFTPIRVVVL